jgi:excisionase family DNA binding protein
MIEPVNRPPADGSFPPGSLPMSDAWRGAGLRLRGRVDPYEALAAALRGVLEEAVACALAGVTSAAGGEAVMVSVAEAAERLGVGTTKLRELVAQGQIPTVVVGRRRLVPVAGLNAFAAGEDGERGRAIA